MDRIRFVILMAVFALGLSCIAHAAQSTGNTVAAPVPTQILAAKKVFIANASGEMALGPGDPDLTYNDFYAAMKTWGRYEIVGSPAEADMVLEIRFVAVPVAVSNGTWDYEIRLVMQDPRSKVTLWAFSQSIPQSGNKARAQQYFDQALGIVVDDLKKLASRTAGS
jgi:hypothetical protein